MVATSTVVKRLKRNHSATVQSPIDTAKITSSIVSIVRIACVNQLIQILPVSEKDQMSASFLYFKFIISL